MLLIDGKIRLLDRFPAERFVSPYMIQILKTFKSSNPERA